MAQQDMRRYQARPTADWMWGPSERPDRPVLATVVVVLASILVLAIGGLVGAVAGWSMTP